MLTSCTFLYTTKMPPVRGQPSHDRWLARHGRPMTRRQQYEEFMAETDPPPRPLQRGCWPGGMSQRQAPMTDGAAGAAPTLLDGAVGAASGAAGKADLGVPGAAVHGMTTRRADQ